MLPEDPAPVAAVLGRLLGALDGGQRPRLAAVERQLHADDFAAASGVGVAANGVFLALAREGNNLQMARVGDGRVDVELVDDEVGLVPPALGGRTLGVHKLGQNPVVHEVEVVVRLLGGHRNVGEPLDHAAANVAGNDEAERVAVVRGQALAVLLVREDEVAGRVHRHVPRDRRAVAAQGHHLGADKADMVCAVGGLLHAALEQHVAQQHALPDGGGDSRSAPAEADCLLYQVLLLAAIAGADEGDRQFARRHGENVIHGEGGGCVDEAADVELVSCPLALGHGAVVAHVVQRRRSQEPTLHQLWQRGLHVERMAAGQTDHVRVAGHPLIGGTLVLGVDGADRGPAVLGDHLVPWVGEEV
mmetsp:Transcript_16157/g.51567  ORF Transcript_16157/g.51567 Transcript_16157/m.51567 type:complete len:360 (+) Transcript_16157:1845-2924(+)